MTTLFLSCIYINPSYGQSFRDRATWGIKAGFVSARIGGDVVSTGIGKLMIGGVLHYPIKEAVTLKAELVFYWFGRR